MAHEKTNTEPGVPEDIDPAEAVQDLPDDPMADVTAGPDGDQAAPAAGDAPEPPAEQPGADAGQPAGDAALRTQLEERTGDLKRLQAEYVNYKRRVDRDRDVSRMAGVESVIMDLVPLLDTLRTAREHEGELTGGFKLLAEELEKVTRKHGLESYGEKGEPFDPQVHDALMQAPMPGIDEPQCLDVMQVGYRLKGRVVRPARVAVALPAEGGAEGTAD